MTKINNMGKTKKKAGKEKDKELGRSLADNSDIDMRDETPLPKLVLKVGKEKKQKEDLISRQDTEHGHHRKKKKKHKHRGGEEVEKKVKKRELNEVVEAEAATTPKKIHLRVSKDKEKKDTYKEPVVSPLDLCLENLHRNLQRKDVYGIFTFPVTDLIAPGYSRIIKTPMDFLTMSKKIGDSEYSSLVEFKEDFVVMCNNAMLYNGSDTIYYKSAEKMLALGLKMLSKDKLAKLKKSIGMNKVLDCEDDDVTIDDSSDVNIDMLMEDETSSPPCYSPPRRRRDNQSVVALALAASRKAREELLKKHPKQLFGYLSKGNNGESTLNILNPDTTEENKSVPVTIGKQSGMLKAGILPKETAIKEEKKNKVVPVNYLMYGPYGSFGPTYDSSLANTTKEESDLLFHTYGSDIGAEYVKSLMNFTSDAPFARDYVDGILDALTNGAHRKYKEVPNGNTNVESDANSKVKEIQSEVDVRSLLTLDGVGIDVTFLKNMVNAEPKEIKNDNAPATHPQNIDSVKAKLTQNATMLNTLKQSQNNRLSTQFGGTTPISPAEIKVATSLTDNLKDMMGMVAPKDVVSSEGVRKAIGCGKSSVNTVDTVEKTNEVVTTSVENSVVQENNIKEPIEDNEYCGDVMETT